MRKLTFKKVNGVAYYKFGESLAHKHTLPIDSVEMLFTPSGVPVAFRFIMSNLKYEWVDSWEELSPGLFKTFHDALKQSSGLRFEKGFFWFNDIPGSDHISIAASSYVDFDSNLEPQGVEFLFRSFGV